uniref:AB hydrolase-1 domain-containing protein n=1 Tax=Pyricularia oryzae (strain 70-15 / ATCC MYA-4617 / FGSC 8958) TaxID=242507 RepID=Q2KH65_PYRO7|nr:hypothetical protein MGCH7_ch7g120 [Pyricularia oryzae 70-15]
MAAQTTIKVPHLGGVTAGYRLSEQPSSNKPVLVLVNSMCTTSSLFDAQFASRALTDAVTLLAVEPLAHGATRCDAGGHYTYWDSAVVALQVMDGLGVREAFALGTSQGGWIVVRMALLAPERILGLLPLGTSMDSESAYSRSKGCWDPRTTLAPFLEAWSTADSTPDFVVDEAWCTAVGSLGFSGAVGAETLQFWSDTLRSVYRGDGGRRMLKMALVNLVERDGLLWRLRDVVCPRVLAAGHQGRRVRRRAVRGAPAAVCQRGREGPGARRGRWALSQRHQPRRGGGCRAQDGCQVCCRSWAQGQHLRGMLSSVELLQPHHISMLCVRCKDAHQAARPASRTPWMERLTSRPGHIQRQSLPSPDGPDSTLCISRHAITNIPPLATHGSRTRRRTTKLWRPVLADHARTPLALRLFCTRLHGIVHGRRQTALLGRLEPRVPVGDRVPRRKVGSQRGEDAVARVLVRHDAVPGGKVGLEELRRQVRVAGQGRVEGEGGVGGLEVLWQREGRHGLEGFFFCSFSSLVATRRKLGVSNPHLHFSRTMIGCAIQKPSPCMTNRIIRIKYTAASLMESSARMPEPTIHLDYQVDVIRLSPTTHCTHHSTSCPLCSSPTGRFTNINFRFAVASTASANAPLEIFL